MSAEADSQGTIKEETPSSPASPSPSPSPSPGPAALFSIRPLPPLGESLRLVPFLSLCAMAGVLTRIGLDKLFGEAVLHVTSAQSETFPDWFANAWGSLVMGFLTPVRHSRFFSSQPWIYVGLTTGYCGCTTTFSSWNQDAASLVVRSDNVGQVVSFLLILLDGLAIPFFFFVVGRHMHSFMVKLVKALNGFKNHAVNGWKSFFEDEDQRIGVRDGRVEQRESSAIFAGEAELEDLEESLAREQENSTYESEEDSAKQEGTELEEYAAEDQRKGEIRERKPEKLSEKKSYWRVTMVDMFYCFIFSFALILLCAAWLLLIVFGGETNRYIWISCLFAPFGAIIRYVLSRYNLWRRCARFPFFTFFVNVVGSIGLAFTVISVNLKDYNIHTDVPGYTLHGLEVGFFGSLTTVSTFIGELYALPTVPYSYIYGFISIAATQIALILINGLYAWL